MCAGSKIKKMNQKIFQTISFWKNFGNFFPISVVIIKKNGDTVYENTVFKKLMNFSQFNLFDYIDQDCLKELNEILYQTDENKTSVSSVLKFKKKQGEISYLGNK